MIICGCNEAFDRCEQTCSRWADRKTFPGAVYLTPWPKKAAEKESAMARCTCETDEGYYVGAHHLMYCAKCHKRYRN